MSSAGPQPVTITVDDAQQVSGLLQRPRDALAANPLQCPKCDAPMRVIALIDDPQVVRRILEHLGRWAPLPVERRPPAQAPDGPPGAAIPLTYHPVPDIA